MLEPTTLRSSSASAVRRDTSSPLRVRSWKPASSPIRWAYSRSRRSATTRSPSSDTKKKRAAVASASATRHGKQQHEGAVDGAAALREALVDHRAERLGQRQRRRARNTPAPPASRRTGPGAGARTATGCAGCRSAPCLGRCRCRSSGLALGFHGAQAHPITGGVAQPRFQGRPAAIRGRRRRRRTPSASKSFVQFFRVERGERRMHGPGDVERIRPAARWHGRSAVAVRATRRHSAAAAAVGADQSAGAELDAAVPARHHRHHLVQSLAIDRGEDRAPGGAGGFAVVVEAVLAADAIGPAVVRGGRVADLGDERQRGLAAWSPARHGR